MKKEFKHSVTKASCCFIHTASYLFCTIMDEEEAEFDDGTIPLSKRMTASPLKEPASNSKLLGRKRLLKANRVKNKIDDEDEEDDDAIFDDEVEVVEVKKSKVIHRGSAAHEDMPNYKKRQRERAKAKELERTQAQQRMHGVLWADEDEDEGGYYYDLDEGDDDDFWDEEDGAEDGADNHEELANAAEEDEPALEAPAPPVLEPSLQALICADDDQRFQVLLLQSINNLPKSRQRSASASKSSISILDLLLASAAAGAVKITELLLNIDVDDVAGSIRKYTLVHEEAEFDDSPAKTSAVQAAAADLDKVTVDLSRASLSALTRMRRGKRLLETNNTRMAHQRTPALVAMLHGMLGVIGVYAEYCPSHCSAVLGSVPPGHSRPVIFSLLPSPESLMAALDSLHTALLVKKQAKAMHGDEKDGMAGPALIRRQRLYRQSSPRRGLANISKQPIVLDEIRKAVLARDANGRTILHALAETCDDEGAAHDSTFVSRLLQLEPAVMHAKDKNGLTPAHMCCVCGAHAILKQLLVADPSITEAVDCKGWTPFLYAVMVEQVKCALLMLSISSNVAVTQLRVLGDILTPHVKREGLSEGESNKECSTRLRDTLRSLGTVPEFHRLLNQVVSENMSLLDEAKFGLGYILMYPLLLDLDNKLMVALRGLRQLGESGIGWRMTRGNFDAREHETTVNLLRTNAWGCLVGLLGNATTNGPASTALSSVYRGHVLLQFAGTGEVGIGRGVEREVLEVISKGMTDVTNTHRIFESFGENIVTELPLPLYKRASGSSETRSTSTISSKASPVVSQTPPCNGPQCNCRQSAVTRTVTKLSKNLGRRFWCCAKPMGDSTKCNFFAWDDGSVVSTMPMGLPSTPSSSQVTTSTQYAKDKTAAFTAFGVLVGHLLLRKICRASQSNTLSEATAASTLRLLHQEDDDDVYYSPIARSSHSAVSGTRSTTSTSKHRGGSCLSLNVPGVFWKIVLNKAVSLHDIQGFDGMLYQSLLYLQDSESVQDLDLVFTVPGQEHGDAEIPLIPNGQAIPVTAGNKDEYLKLIIAHHTHSRMAAQAAVVRSAIITIIPSLILGLFSEQDLSCLLIGLPEVNVEEWKSYVCYNGCSSATCHIRWFWELLAEMTQQELGLLLRFCTGCSRLSAGGFCALQPRFNITLVAYDPARALPTAATCFNMLKLPMYPDSRTLRKCITTAVLYGSEGFGFS